MLESISLTPKMRKKQRICLPLNAGNSKKMAETIDPRQLSDRNQPKKQISQQISHHKAFPSAQLPTFFENNHQSSRIADSRAIRLAQSQLQDKYKCDLSGYLRKKFQKYLGKKHEFDHRESHIALSLSNSSSEERITFRQLLTLEKYDVCRHQKSTGVNEAYLRNAKERIDRMVNLKRQREEYYSDVRALLKKKLMDKQKIRQKTEWKSERNKKQQWEKEWLSEYINEKKRYRKRLVNKSINKRYQLSPP